MEAEAYYNCSFKVPKSEEWLLKEVERLRRLDGISKSELIREALKEYVEKHKEGNPQKPILPFTKVWEAPPVEKRYDNLVWVQSFVERNQGKMTVLELINQFSVMSGLKKDTAEEYVKLLLSAKRLKVEGGKVYSKNMQKGTETPKQ
jgi:hypothetical protein